MVRFDDESRFFRKDMRKTVISGIIVKNVCFLGWFFECMLLLQSFRSEMKVPFEIAVEFIFGQTTMVAIMVFESSIITL